MISPWQSPLPLEEHKTSRVVVYFYSDRLSLWIPIVFFCLIEALELHRKGLFNGVEFFVFPPDLDPCSWGEGGMGRGEQGDKGDKGDKETSGEIFLLSYPLPIPNYPLPIPNYPLPITNN